MRAWLIWTLFILNASTIFAYEKADAFIVNIYDDRVKVLSPTKYDPKLAVIIQNKTLVAISGKVQTKSGRVISYIRVEPSKSGSVSVKALKDEPVFFIPLSPPSQQVELKLGSKPYEIPPRQ